MNYLSALIAYALVGASLSPAFAQTDPRIEAAESAVKEGLKDPGSAQFKNEVVKTNSVGETAVCGEYNARNSFGGYVGFQPFGVVGSVPVTKDNVPDLERMGCFGPDAELARRHSDAQNQLGNKLHDQADFSCNVIWTMMDNRFRLQQDMNTVLDAAMVAMKNRAQENRAEIAPDMLKAIRSQFEAQLAKIEQDKNTVVKVRKGDVTFKDVFLSSCTLQTDQMLRIKAGLQ
jgi:hypothetical protein